MKIAEAKIKRRMRADTKSCPVWGLGLRTSIGCSTS